MAKIDSGDIIICAKLDRMFRSALDALIMVKAFISKLFFTIISAVAEAERDRIVQRIVDVKREAERASLGRQQAFRLSHQERKK